MKEIQTEKEITLVILSQAPASIADEICQLTSISDYKLQFVGTRNIRDSYFDTPATELKSAGWALRLRQIDEAAFLALKGPSKISDSGILERLEIEGAWSEDLFRRVLAEMGHAGPNFDVSGQWSELSDPFSIIEASGFRLVQIRETSRRLMDVFNNSRTQRVAEIAVDLVNYRFEMHTREHYEVEVESKSEIGSEVLKEIVAQLKSRFGVELRIWHHSKLATGYALETLLQNEEFRSSPTTFNDAVYDRIDALLSHPGQ